jgi:hypothetical protein
VPWAPPQPDKSTATTSAALEIALTDVRKSRQV